MRQIVNHKLATIAAGVCVLGVLAGAASASVGGAAAGSHNGAGALVLLCLGGFLFPRHPSFGTKWLELIAA
ncbi:MAG: hypothetical protein KGS45_09200 [Planctomycetes bacterium]|nr:hypothetical protein [Planctomycetota bacterium]